MKILGIVCGAVLILLVALAAVQGALSDKARDWEGKAAAVQAGLRQAESDGRRLSQRIAEISREIPSREKSLLALLADEQVNHLAETHLGRNFALNRRELVGRLETARHLQAKRKDPSSTSRLEQAELERKIRELERRQRQLLRSPVVASSGSVLQRQWEMQVENVESQLSQLRGQASAHASEREPAGNGKRLAERGNAAEVAGLVGAHEAETIQRLAHAIEVQATSLRQATADAQGVRRWAEALDIWPIRWLAPLFRHR